MIVKYAKFDASILEVRSTPVKPKLATIDKLSEFTEWQTHMGFLYCRIRAISSRINQNFDSWPSVELAGSPEIFNQHRSSKDGHIVIAAQKDAKYGFSTFLGKPVFVDHNNSDPQRARGIVVDAKLHVEDHKTAALDPFYSSPEAEDYHSPPTWVELLLEVDAKTFPKFTKALIDGSKDPTKGIDGFSMGANVEKSSCNICGNEAVDASSFCNHVALMKGSQHVARDKAGNKIMKRIAEKCIGVKFFELSGVFTPADETALTMSVIAGIRKEGSVNSWNNKLKQGAFDAGMNQGTGTCARCGGRTDPDHGNECVQCQYSDPNTNLSGMGTNALEVANPLHPYQAAGNYPDIEGTDHYIDEPCPTCKGAGYQNGVECPGCNGEGTTNSGFYAQPKGEISSLMGRQPQDYPPMPQGLQEQLMNTPAHFGKVAAGDTPQSDLLTIPEHVDTLRKEETCKICGSSMDDGTKCGVCGYCPPPDSLDNPDLNKAQERVQQNVPPNDGSHIEGYEDPLQRAQTPPPRTVPPPNIRNSPGIMSSMEWTFYHPRLGAGKINPIERPALPNGPPATNEPIRETIITNPQAPITSRTAASMIADIQQKENHMEKTADAAAPSVAAPDTNVGVVEVGGVMDASNEAASTADAQVDVLGIGGVMSDVGADHDSMQTAAESSDDSGFNTDKTTDDSGPTMVWTLGEGSAVERSKEPVTTEPYPSEGGVTSSQHLALDAEPYPSDNGPGLSGGGANQGVQPSDPVGNAEDRVDVLDATTTPANNSGPTKTWSGTGGNSILRQQEPVTGETLEGEDGVKRSAFTPHIVNAVKLADLEVEMGTVTADEKHNYLAALIDTHPAIIEDRLQTLARVRTAGLRRSPSITRTAGRLPSFNKAASEATEAPAFVPDESLFLRG